MGSITNPPATVDVGLIGANGQAILSDNLANLFAQVLVPSVTGRVDSAEFFFQECDGGGMLAGLASKLDSITFQNSNEPELSWAGGAAANWDMTASDWNPDANAAGYFVDPWTTQLVGATQFFGLQTVAGELTAGNILGYQYSNPSQTYIAASGDSYVYPAVQKANSQDWVSDPSAIAANSSEELGTDNGGEDVIFAPPELPPNWPSIPWTTRLTAVLWSGSTAASQIADIDAMYSAIKSAWEAGHDGNISGLNIIELVGANATAAKLQWAMSQPLFGPGTQFLFYATGHGGMRDNLPLATLALGANKIITQTFSLYPGAVSQAQKSDPPTLTVDYSGVLAPDTVRVLWNDISLGYLEPGQTEEVFNLPVDSLNISNDFAIENGGASAVSLDSVSFWTGSVADTGVQPNFLSSNSVVSSGQTISNMEVPDGIDLDVLSGGAAIGTIIGSGGTEIVSSGGTDSGATIGGAEYVQSGGKVSGATVGSGGLEIVSAGAIDEFAQIDGGDQDVYGTASGAAILTGSQIVESGGTAIGTTISGGMLEVASGGSLGSAAVTFAGIGGTLQIYGASMPGAVISGFALFDTVDLAGVGFNGNGSATLVSGNVLQIVENGQTYDLNFDPTQNFAGEQFSLMWDGGSGTDVAISGTPLLVGSGQTYNVFSGQEYWDIAVQGGGTLNVLPGAAVNGVTVDGGGSEYVNSGGIVGGTIIDSAGYALVASGGTASGTTISGGTLEVASGGSLGSGPVDFAGQNGTLQLDGAATLSNVISGLAAGDVIDLAGVSFAGSASVTLQSGNVLQVVENANTYDLQLDPLQNFSGEYLHLLPDAISGTDIALGQLTTVSVGQTVSNTSVTDGGVQDVYGTTIDATVASRGEQVVFSAGTASSTTVGGGGYQMIEAGGSAIGTTVGSGGYQVIESSGTASGTTVSSGGTLELIGGASAIGPKISAGGTLEIGYGYSVSGETVSGGVTLEVASGGTASATTVGSGGTLELLGGATAIGVTILSPTYPTHNTLEIGPGYTLGGYAVSAGTLEVLSGGTISGTIIDSAGNAIVASGGTAVGTQVSGGEEDAFSILSGGTASGTTITDLGSDLVGQGAVEVGATVNLFASQEVDGVAVSTTLENSSEQQVNTTPLLNGSTVTGTAIGTTVGSGCTEVDLGTTVSTTVSNGGLEQVGFVAGSESYIGTASGTIIDSGGTETVSSGSLDISATIDGTEIVSSGGTASAAIIGSGGMEIISAGAADEFSSIGGGEQKVYGIATADTVDSGAQVVELGGTASVTWLDNSGVEIVSSGGVDESTSIDGGEQDVYGTASGVTIWAGSQVVEAGGVASGTTVNSGGTLELLSGATMVGTTVSAGGTLEIGSGYVISDYFVSSGATLEIASGGAASGTTLSSGGTLELLGGTTTNGVAISAGDYFEVGSGYMLSGYGVAAGIVLEVASGGTASSATVETGGAQYVYSGGIAASTTIDSGGYLFIASGGAANGATISGGTLEVASGGSLGSGAITFAGQNGALQIDDTAMPSNVISGLAAGDVIDLAGVGFASAGSVTLQSGSVLQVVENGSAYNFQLNTLQNFSGENFHLLPDAISGTDIALGPLATASAGQTVSNTSVTGGDIQNVFGTAIDATVASGGEQDVFSGGTASGTTVGSGGYEVIGAGATVGDATVDGGLQDVFGMAAANTVSDYGYQYVYSAGEASGTIVSAYGGQIVCSGGVASGSIIGSSGDEYVDAGGVASGTIIGSAGYECVETGATASGTTISGGTLEVASGGSLGSGPLTFAGSGGTLQLDDTNMPANTITGFEFERRD